MDFEQFIESVKNEVRALVGSECSVSVNCVMKINRELQGLSILQNGTECSPSVYLEEFYEEYKKGKAIMDIAAEIVQISRKGKQNMTSVMENIRKYEWAKPRLRVKLINYQKNERLLMTIPHEKLLDLAVIPYVLISKDNGFMTTKVNFSILEQWGITAEALMQQAKENTIIMCPVIIEEMTDFILHAMLKEMDSTDNSEEGKDKENLLRATLNKGTTGKEMYILTNESNMDGSFAAFQTKELAELTDQIGIDTVYILPSSIHELLAVPAVGMEPHNLRDMVREINYSQVPEEDFLSDSVYIYSRIKNEVSIAA